MSANHFNRIKRAIEVYQSRIHQLEAQLQRRQMIDQQLHSEKDALQFQLRDLAERLDAAMDNVNVEHEQNIRLREETADLRKFLASSQEQVSSLSAQNKALEAKIKDLEEAKCEKLQGVASSLEVFGKKQDSLVKKLIEKDYRPHLEELRD
jgi:chromosome segregation ATPase